MELTDRVQIVKSNKGVSNCFGTALYLTGILDEDRVILDEAVDYLKLMDRVDKVESFCLVTLFEYGPAKIDRLSHMAIVTNLNPILVMDRTGRGGPFRENIHFESVIDDYSLSNRQPEFYVPKLKV